jgi:hypothetical protein
MARGSFTRPRLTIQAKASEAEIKGTPDEAEKPEETGREIPDFLKPRSHIERTPGAEPRGKCWPYW